MWIICLLAIVTLAGAAALVWRFMPAVIARAVRPIDAAKLGFHAAGDDARLAESVGEAFRFGVRARLCGRRGDWISRCESLDPHWRPFAFEGAAFGFGALASTRHARWTDMVEQTFAPRPGYVHLAHVGVGFWGAFWYGRRFHHLLRQVQSFDPLYRYLCLDGYGFKFAFFDYMQDRRAVAHLHNVPGYWRNAAFQGVGRGLYFAFLGDRRGLFEAVGRFAPDHDADVIAGVALATAFAGLDRPHAAVDFARAVPFEWRPHVHLGLTFGYKARLLTDPGHFEQCLSPLPAAGVAAIRRAIDLCDLIEQEVRREQAPQPYRLWRERLTRRMERERMWEPVYARVAEGADPGGRGVVRNRSGDES